MNPVTRRPASGATKVTILAALLVASSCAFLVMRISDKGIRPSGVTAAVMLTLAFFVAEVFPIHVPVGDDRHTISFNELPLAIGLVLLGPAALIASTLAGNGTALVLHRRQRGVKLGFNLALGAFQAAVAVALFSIVGDGQLWTARTCIALVLATVGADTISGVLVALAITLFRGTPEGLWTTRVFCNGAIESMIKSLLGILAVVALIEHNNFALALAVESSTIAYMVYRAHAQRRTEHALAP